MELGNINKTTFMKSNRPKDKAVEATHLNGFNTYYRLLFSIAIFSNGKCFNLNTLGKISNLSIDKIKGFLYKFNSILTLNYDCLLENILSDFKICYLHGSFILNKKEYVNNQSLGLRYENDKYVSFSDILIGDYFYNKVNRSVINVFSKNEMINKKTQYYTEILKSIIESNKINAVLIFGMNIQNDQHILRNIMSSFYFSKIVNPRIIYCYFTEEEKLDFDETFYKVITFSEELSAYAAEIEVMYIDSKEILATYFYNNKMSI